MQSSMRTERASAIPAVGLPRLTQPDGCYTMAIVRLLLVGGAMGVPDRTERTVELTPRRALQLVGRRRDLQIPRS
jgi:hypothetical protein